MNKLLISMVIALVITACGGDSFKKETVDPVVWVEYPIEGMVLHDGDVYWAYGGDVDYDSLSGGYITTSHTKMDCVLDNGILSPLKSECRKADFGITTLEDDSNFVEGRVTKYSFDFTVNSLNLQKAPDWIIIFQDWVDIDPNDTNGNHPISTLKLKVSEGKLSIGHYDNSWQFNHIWDEADPEDKDHTTHQENDLNGSAIIDVGVTYSIEIIIKDSVNSDGSFIVSLNGEEFSNARYQTKFEGYTSNAVHRWGLYISKGYDIGLNSESFDGQFDKNVYPHVLYSPSNQISISFDNFKRYLKK